MKRGREAGGGDGKRQGCFGAFASITSGEVRIDVRIAVLVAVMLFENAAVRAMRLLEVDPGPGGHIFAAHQNIKNKFKNIKK